MKRSLSTVLFIAIMLTGALTSFAQRAAHVYGDVMVRILPDADIEEVAGELTYILGVNAQTKVKELISPQMDIWLLDFDHTKVNERHFLDFAKAHPKVMEAQFNHILTQRQTIPDDPQLGQQWHWINDGQTGGTPDADVDGDNAWDITTGGLTANGDTIVVAVIDDGAELDHPDLADNWWRNWAEIPNNNIDDDGNGYVDDYFGWNNANDSDNVGGGAHGVNVAGMIGGIGNNANEGCGINWNVKIMAITGNYGNEAGSISAYTYALTQRQIYNETDGDAGAFVVATNSSWGVDFGQPADAPLWCAFYDTLGVNGILNCGATANNNVDIDAVGDLPTACPSEYMIAVTATNDEDVRTFSGYGAATIDLGAPGEAVYTADNGGGYTTTSGTSFASPTVAGIIGLLYSAPCSNIANIAASDPKYAAEQIRDYLFQGVDPISNLTNETVYGGRANAYNSLQLILANCGPCPPPYSLEDTNFSDTDATLSWIPGDSTLSVNLQWREIGMATWNTIPNVTSPYDLTGLVACTNYEFQVQAECASETSDYSQALEFKTDGCCEPPVTLEAINLTDVSADLTWNSVLAANSYNLRWREVGAANWNTEMGVMSPYSLTGLTLCSSYIFEVQVVCNSGEITDWSTTYDFSTTCGPCTANAFCEAGSGDSSFEWIESVEIDGVANISGNNDGYAGFFNTPYQMMQGATHSITLTPEFSNQLYDEWWVIYIDLDQNGTFDMNELLYDSGAASDAAVTGDIIMPATAQTGITRMRIMMRWQEATTGPCSNNYDYGEVEDYCVEILEADPTACDPPNDLDASIIATNMVELNWTPTANAADHNVRYRETGTTPWTDAGNIGTPPYTLDNLVDCAEYEYQVQSVCDLGTTGSYSPSFVFDADCVGINDLPEGITSFYATPNPFDEQFTIFLDLEQMYNVQFELVNINGQVLQSLIPTNLTTGTNTIEMNMNQRYTSGIYFLRIVTNEGTDVVKLLKR